MKGITAKRRAAKRARLEREKRAVYAQVDARDQGFCRLCCRLAAHHHHIRYRSRGGAHSVENVVSVCLHCHEAIHMGRVVVTGTAEALSVEQR